ncbi:pentatricopeptide repeat-containing protein At5g15300-like [Wolffia australiana]
MIRKSGHKRFQPAAWRRCRSLRTLRQFHARMVVAGFESDLGGLRELLYCAAVLIPGALAYAHLLFSQVSRPELFLWNTLIRGAAHGPRPADALSLFLRMHPHLSPDRYTFPFLLKAGARLPAPALGPQLHASAAKRGLDAHSPVRNALIHFHAACGHPPAARALFLSSPTARADPVAWSALVAGLAKRGSLPAARVLFDAAPVKDLVSWNVMLTAYAKARDMPSARQLFDEMPRRDVVSWNAVIAGYVAAGAPDKALALFDDMAAAGHSPDEVTLLSLLSACAELGDLCRGARLHAAAPPTTAVGNALIAMYARGGSAELALGVFRAMPERDVASWNSAIGALALHGRSAEAVALFGEMRRLRLRPDEISFVAVLAACSHGGLVDEGRRCFALMAGEYGIRPNVKHLGCMVDLLGRAGRVEEAFRLAERAGEEGNSVVWRALLGACRTHGEVAMAELANARLGGESGDYVLLSNTYAAAGEWGAVEKTRRVMDERKVPKAAGRSLVEPLLLPQPLDTGPWRSRVFSTD